MTDFSLPQRMSTAAFFIIFTKIFKSVAGAAVILIFVRAIDFNSDSFIETALTVLLIGLSACFVLSLVLAIAAYFPKKFYVKDGNLIFIHGIINRETTTIPLDRVHSLRTKQDLWYRLLDMRGVIFDTLAAKGEDIELILSETHWKNLLNLIEQEERPQTTAADLPPIYNPISTMRFSHKSLILDALCQNHFKGLAILGSFLAVIFDRLNDFTDNAAETISNYAYSFSENMVLTPLYIIILLVVTYLIVLALWMGKVLLRYYDMSLTYDKKMLTFSHGLISRSSSRFAYRKVCAIWVKRNFLEKKLGLCTLMLKQAVNVTAQNEEDNLKLYGADTSEFFLKWWLGKEYMDATEIITAKSGRGVIAHSLLPDLLITAVATATLCKLNMYLWVAIPLIYFIASIFKGILAMRRSRITLKDSYIVINDGRFAEISNYVKYRDVEVVRIRHTPFTRIFHRVTLTLSTPGTTYSVRSLKEREAQEIYELILSAKLDEPMD